MLSFFRKKTAKQDEALRQEKPVTQLDAKSMNEVIEEIHETFYTEVDKLLAEAKVSNSIETDKQDLLDKCERLKALGFTNTKEVKEAKAEIERLNLLRTENEIKKELIEAINYFSFKYPNYKFITEDSVKSICKKYNLVYGTIDRYIGTVPDKNLKHIEDFAIREEDTCYQEITLYGSYMGAESKIYISSHDSLTKVAGEENTFRQMLSNRIRYVEKCPLEIAAPLKDFDANRMEVKGYNLSKIEIPDPIVLKPVFFKNKKHYLIVTAWGLEASDELVVNQKMN